MKFTVIEITENAAEIEKLNASIYVKFIIKYFYKNILGTDYFTGEFSF